MDATPPQHLVLELVSPPSAQRRSLSLYRARLAQSVTCDMHDTTQDRNVWRELQIARQGLGRDSVQGSGDRTNANADQSRGSAMMEGVMEPEDSQHVCGDAARACNGM